MRGRHLEHVVDGVARETRPDPRRRYAGEDRAGVAARMGDGNYSQRIVAEASPAGPPAHGSGACTCEQRWRGSCCASPREARRQDRATEGRYGQAHRPSSVLLHRIAADASLLRLVAGAQAVRAWRCRSVAQVVPRGCRTSPAVLLIMQAGGEGLAISGFFVQFALAAAAPRRRGLVVVAEQRRLVGRPVDGIRRTVPRMRLVSISSWRARW